MQKPNSKTTQKKQEAKTKIKLPILVPLLGAISTLMLTFSLAVYHLQQQRITDDVRMRLDKTREFFSENIDSDAQILDSIIHFLKKDQSIQNAWLAKDRDILLDNTRSLFDKFRLDYGITHFYFIDTNNVCFLRIHNPTRYGDHIDRFTLNQAAETKLPAFGIELGPFGTFTLRMVHPWFINNTFAGFIELGEEIEHITPKLEKALDVDLVFLINKTFLIRDNWEQGQKMMGRTGNWDVMREYVIVDSTLYSIPPEFIEFAALPPDQQRGRFVSSKFNDSYYRAGCVPLFDAAGKNVGNILVIKDISLEQASLHELLVVVAILCFFVVTSLSSIFYFQITRIEKHLIDTHASLETEIEKRKKAESELCRHSDNLEALVKKRTVELEKSNRHLKHEITQRTNTEVLLERVNKELELTVIRLSQSNRQLREFAHLTAHDLKTPLRGIGILAQWLFQDYYEKFDQKGRQKVNLLLNRIERTDKLMEAILEYSTVARNEYNERHIDLNIALREALAEIRLPDNIKITISKNLPNVTCEQKHIQKVFYTLLENAINAMDKSDGRITIDYSEEDLFWKFSISDNGHGIEPQHYERIFMLFQTLNSNDDAENIGMGLTLARRIVELYDGNIWLTSKIGEGTTFFFTLPKKPAAVTLQTPQLIET